MSHYFDDILHRHVGGAQTPKSPVLSSHKPRFRRSSTSRSISARSDFDVHDLHGYDEDDGDVRTRRGSVAASAINDPVRMRERAEADAHLHSYISQQLERVKMEQIADGYSGGEEFEAHAEPE